MTLLATDQERPVGTPAPSFFAGRPWYGNEVLICDGVSGALIGLGVGLALHKSTLDAAEGVLGLGLGGYVLAPPIMHAAHERLGIATASLSMRVFMPFFGGVLGAYAGPSEGCPNDGPFGACSGGSGSGFAVGALTGMVLASALDVGLFSYENHRTEAEATSTFGLVPALSADGKRGELRAFGTF